MHNVIDGSEHRLRVEWLRKNRSEICPDCTRKDFEKKEWHYTRWCPDCQQIWRTVTDFTWAYD